MKTARDVEDEAAKWLVLNDKSLRRPEEIAAFEAWLAADARHRAAYLRLKAAWRKASVLFARRRPYDGSVDIDLLQPEAPQHASSGPLAFGLAALAVVALIALG
ncbi:MAG: FecR/PupR family sigma factor regulator, partial [Steroidobacteraceae bacterium]